MQSHKAGLINVEVIAGINQLANPLTKFFSSPTDHWREAENV
jgi:Flp pilus assembly pilin Flp